MLLALKYLTCYLGAMVSVIMILTTVVSVVISPLGLMLVILLAVMTLSLIRVMHPPAPPYRITLLFRQVRIRLGLLPNLNYIDVKTEVDDHLTAAARTLMRLEV
ncbi:unnamed protein product [marine sediment metagenome]|uniref:Uncharacterized protein n=1 Tax=marine sediment metagenome TaxID=412755 RepID=X1DEI6_9ZZZZ